MAEKISERCCCTSKRQYHQNTEKTFVAVLTRSQHKAHDPIRIQETESKSRRPPAVAAVQKLLDERRLSSLRRLVGTIEWTWRAAKKFLRAKIGDKEKWEAVHSSGVITPDERGDVFRNLCLAAQEGVHFPNTTTDRLFRSTRFQGSNKWTPDVWWQDPDFQR